MKKARIVALLAVPLMLGAALWPVAQRHHEQVKLQQARKATHDLLTGLIGANITLEQVRQLLDEGADVNARDSYQASGSHDYTDRTLLQLSLYHSPKITKLLIERGANVNTRTMTGTALSEAESCGVDNDERVRLLKAAGAKH